MCYYSTLPNQDCPDEEKTPSLPKRQDVTVWGQWTRLSWDRQRSNKLHQRGKGLARSRGCVGNAPRQRKAQDKQGESGWTNKGLGNAKNWATLMRAATLPCQQKAGEGGGKGKESWTQWETVEDLQRELEKVIWNLSLMEINSTVGQEFGGRVSRDESSLMQNLGGVQPRCQRVLYGNKVWWKQRLPLPQGASKVHLGSCKQQEEMKRHHQAGLWTPVLSVWRHHRTGGSFKGRCAWKRIMGYFGRCLWGTEKRAHKRGNMTGLLWKCIRGESSARWTNWRELGVTVSIIYEM